jgi:hypothetical protein
VYFVCIYPFANVNTVDMRHFKTAPTFLSFHYCSHFPYYKGKLVICLDMDYSWKYGQVTMKQYFQNNAIQSQFTRKSTVRNGSHKNQFLGHKKNISSHLTQFRKISAIYCDNSIIKLINSLCTGFHTVTPGGTCTYHCVLNRLSIFKPINTVEPG